MDDQFIGAILRAARIQAGLRQEDVGDRVGLSRATISRAERGHFQELPLTTLRKVGEALDVRMDLVARRRGGDLGRMVNAGHAAMHEAVGRRLSEIAGWEWTPEVSFSIYGERGVIDIFAFHPGRLMLLVIELKTEIVDVSDLIGGVDRKRRLALRIARERGWQARYVSSWVIVADSRTNHRRLAAHSTTLRQAFPVDGRTMDGWLRDPERTVAALSFLPDDRRGNVRQGLATSKRVATRRPAAK